MVPLVGMQAAGSALPITARGALLDSSDALSLVTDRDFLALQVSIPREHKVFQMACGTHHSSIGGTECTAVDTEEKGSPAWHARLCRQMCYLGSRKPSVVTSVNMCCAVHTWSVVLGAERCLPDHRGLCKHLRPAQSHHHAGKLQLHPHTSAVCGPGACLLPTFSF